ncbi:hypothetical protein M9435_004527 [Picochlorum sp. BPE23]|nr:hypothetical protein M9435_004527 [Picochlorum sp. BPE23]
MSRNGRKSNSPDIPDNSAVFSGSSTFRRQGGPNEKKNNDAKNFVEDEIDAQLLPSPFEQASVQSQSSNDAKCSPAPDLEAADTLHPERIHVLQESYEQVRKPLNFLVDDLNDHNLVIGSQLGAGSYGRVYHGFHLLYGEVAVKIVHIYDSETLLIGSSEICACLATGQHPNIAKIFETRIYQRPKANDTSPKLLTVTADEINEQIRQISSGNTESVNSQGSRMRVDVFSTDPESMRDLQVCLLSLKEKSAVTDKIYFAIVGEYCNGGTLYEALRKGAWLHNNLQRKFILLKAIVLSTACAMQHLHQNNIIHRDLSNANVMLHYTRMHEDGKPDKESLTAKLIDFGHASLNATKTMKINSLCTVSYSAPEFMVNAESSKASDVFSLGVLMWEVWTGCLAWEGAKDVQVFYAVTTGKTLEISADLPDELARLMKSCMSFDPKDRPGIKEVVNQLRRMTCAQEEGGIDEGSQSE